MNKYSLVIDNSLLEENTFLGMLIHPTNPENGMLVLNSKSNELMLQIYRITLNSSFEFHITKILTSKIFNTSREMNLFLEKFSNFKANQFTEFLNYHDNDQLH